MRAVLRGASVVDGTGAPARRADVAIADGRIAGVGRGLAFDFEEVDLSGLVLSPGFIDPHTHYDAQVFWDPDYTPSSWHGVTTVVTGNCGFTLAPTRPEHRETIVLTLENVEGMPLAALQAGIPWSFETFPEYLQAIDAIDKRLNVACMIGHTALRWYVLGDDAPDRRATDDEVQRMCELVREALACGAVGFSTSWHTHIGAFGKPVPSRAAGFEELVSLAEAVGSTGMGTIEMVIHEGIDVDEVVRIARAAGRPLTWSGDVLLPVAGTDDGAANAAVQKSRAAPSVYPQFACQPIIAQVTLHDPFPLRSASDGFLEALQVEPGARMALYLDEGWRRSTKERLRPLWAKRLESATVEETVAHSRLRHGPTLGQLAAERNTTPFDLLVDLSVTDDLATRFNVAIANTDEAVIGELLQNADCLLGLSDAGAHISQHCEASYGTHLLGYWVRERRALPLELAVRHLTGQPAAVYGLADRGRIAVGSAADLVAFDPDRVGAEHGERVRDLPGGADRVIVASRGVDSVWVNGTPIRRNEEDLPNVGSGRRLSGNVLVERT